MVVPSRVPLPLERFSFACINAEPPSRRGREGFLGEKGSLASKFSPALRASGSAVVLSS